MTTENLLIELGTEELPPKSLRKLAESFAEHFEQQLVSNNFGFEDVKWLASPKRLALVVNQLQAQQADQNIEKKGPSVQAAFDDNGEPTKAAQGWARSNGITVQEAQRLTTDKGEWLLFKTVLPGKNIQALIQTMLDMALSKLPIPKPMRWGEKKAQFIRPVHQLTVMLGSTVLEASAFGVKASNTVRGHRFHSQGLLNLAHADDYQTVLADNKVIADFEQRKKLIKELVTGKASELNATITPDDDLLEEVTGLVEWPVALVASFDEGFLRVPKEALIYTMKDDQKYFPLIGQDGSLLSQFIFVSNIESKDPQQVISGNEKVIRPRLADAQFFFDSDRQKSLEQHAEKLSTIVFQKQLGTIQDKCHRVADLAQFIASKIDADEALSHRAGLLSKADLMTKMVYEFPDVQGVMGMHYARHDGEHEDVSLALNEQYMPRFAGDTLPQSRISCAVSIADKIDTLVGIFGIGQTPKGDKDPFALRRAAIGIIRILAEKDISLDVTQVIAKAEQLYADRLTAEGVSTSVFDFILNRYKAYYQEQGIATETIMAVQVLKPVCPTDFDKRVKAVQHFLTMEESQSLAAANKRVSNILNKLEEQPADAIDSSLFENSFETALVERLKQLKSDVANLFNKGNYKDGLVQLSALKEDVDNFFDNVMVMADDDKVKNNRLAILQQLRGLFLNVADLSEL